MSCCAPSITPDYSGNTGGGGGGSGVQTITAGTNITITGTATNPTINAITGERPAYTIYVSPSGNDLSGNGSIQSPFLTIQKAIDYRQTQISENVIVEILIYSGIYSEDLTISMGNTILTGYSSVQYDTPQVFLNGSSVSSSFISIDLTIGEGFVLVGFSNITMNEENIEKLITSGTLSNTGGYNLAFNNCNIRGSLNLTSSTYSKATTVSLINCNIKSDNSSASLIHNSGCILTILQSQLDHTVANTVPVILMEANGIYQGVLNCQYSNIRSSTLFTSPFPIIKYNISKSFSTTEQISYNTIYYTDSQPDTGNNKCCIQYNLLADVYFIVMNMNYNSFICDGANTYCVQTVGSIGSLSINNLCNNYAANSANKISTNRTSINNVLIPVTQ